MNITIIYGSTRPGNYGQFVAAIIKNIAVKKFPDINFKVISPKDFTVSYDGAKVKEYTQLVEETDAFIVVVSEYNHGYPGMLKSLMDLEFEKYFGKPVLVTGLSDGQFGGARGVEAFVNVLKAYKMLILGNDILINHVDKKFSKEGELLDSTLSDYITKTVTELVLLAKKLNRM